ncbi:MAG TPA: hypothetical protein VN259_05520, partial [Xanthomonadales bacterium]|nr:hypothetical protein [Xanthomonadales bacterium]
RTNPSGLTAAAEPAWWVEALTNTPAGIDPATGLKRPPREWRKVKNEGVLRAIEEINEVTSIEIGLIEHKTGRAITSVQFSVRRKQAAAQPADAPRVPADLAEMAVRLEVGLRDLVALAGRYPLGTLRVALARLEQRVLREDLDPVGSRLAYLRAVLDEADGLVGEPVGVSLAQAQAPAKEPAREPDPAAPSARDLRVRAIREEMQRLSPEERIALQARTVEDLRRRSSVLLTSPALVRKIQAGEFQSGALASAMLDVFATERYGSNWAAADE